ncbi:hypothetical protein BST33_05865 [Mycolicibacter minnesotensis]|uniref:Uncharacterized protein n=2 Tax=Mycolicibacter minnesotensis TaxID=1118379 RepID=A0A7I7R3K2_9MYCO|nr:hypothetical protein BST33_05865 [Mycolicibacter minnesotensis]BBY32716.1 hypothetical protein MMIN_07770 [Mycolicibacter minnesotensis]
MPRADDRVDDRPSLADLGESDPDYVARAATGWAEDTRYLWAVCEPTTGELLAEVALNPGSGEIGIRHRPGHDQAGQTGAQAVFRFAAAALGLAPATALADSPAAADEKPDDAADRQG